MNKNYVFFSCLIIGFLFGMVFAEMGEPTDPTNCCSLVAITVNYTSYDGTSQLCAVCMDPPDCETYVAEDYCQEINRTKYDADAIITYKVDFSNSPVGCTQCPLRLYTNTTGTWSLMNYTDYGSTNIYANETSFIERPTDNKLYNRTILATPFFSCNGLYFIRAYYSLNISNFTLKLYVIGHNLSIVSPNITLYNPLLDNVTTNSSIYFNCTSKSTTKVLKNLTLKTNISGNFIYNFSIDNQKSLENDIIFMLNFNGNTSDEQTGEGLTSVYHEDGTTGLLVFNYTDGLFGQAINLSEKFSLVYNSTNNINISQNFTVSFWIRPNIDYDFLGVSPFYFLGNTLYNNRDQVYVAYDSTNKALTYRVEKDDNNNLISINLNMKKNNWYHVVATTNGTYNALYFNGILKSTQQFVGVPNWSSQFMININNSNYCNCSMDEFIIYNKTLTSSQILTLYNRTFLNLNTTVNLATYGNYSWNCEVYDIDNRYNTSSTNRTFSYVSGEQYPLISFISQSPQDINTLNTFGVDVNFSYNISDNNHLNLWNATLFFKTNTTGSDTYKYINGTSTSGWFNRTFMWNSTTKWNVTLRDNSVYPATYNFDEELMESYNHSNYTLIGQNSYLKILFYNVSSSKNYSMFEIMSFNNSGTVNDLRFYYCNSSYVSGNILANVNCALFFSKNITASWNHIHSQYSKHILIPFSMNSSGYVAGIKVTSRSYFIVRGVVGLGWNISYISNVTNTSRIQTTSNSGNAWTNFVGTIDSHLHQFNGSDTFYYYACVNDSASQVNCTSVRNDLLNLSGLPPTGINVFNPTENYYKGNITINWTEALSPNSYPIILYNVSLVDENQTFNSTITTNTTDLNSTLNSVGLNDGIYFIKVMACDNFTQCSFGLSENFTIDNHAPEVFAQFIDSPTFTSLVFNWTIKDISPYNITYIQIVRTSDGFIALTLYNFTGIQNTFTGLDLATPYTFYINVTDILNQSSLNVSYGSTPNFVSMSGGPSYYLTYYKGNITISPSLINIFSIPNDKFSIFIYNNDSIYHNFNVITNLSGVLEFSSNGFGLTPGDFKEVIVTYVGQEGMCYDDLIYFVIDSKNESLWSRVIISKRSIIEIKESALERCIYSMFVYDWIGMFYWYIYGATFEVFLIPKIFYLMILFGIFYYFRRKQSKKTYILVLLGFMVLLLFVPPYVIYY